jgi:uncharacterized protein YuzE
MLKTLDTTEAMYIAFSNDKVARSEEVIDSVLIIDYNSAGKPIGIEVLSPVRISDLEQYVDPHARKPFRKFIRSTAPDELLLARA